MPLDYDEGRVVRSDASNFLLGYDEGRVAADQGRPLAEIAFFLPDQLAYDQGRVVHDPLNALYLTLDQGRVGWSDGRPTVEGIQDIPVLPLGPDEIMLGEMQANRVRAQRQDVSIHKL